MKLKNKLFLITLLFIGIFILSGNKSFAANYGKFTFEDKDGYPMSFSSVLPSSVSDFSELSYIVVQDTYRDMSSIVSSSDADVYYCIYYTADPSYYLVIQDNPAPASNNPPYVVHCYKDSSLSSKGSMYLANCGVNSSSHSVVSDYCDVTTDFGLAYPKRSDSSSVISYKGNCVDLTDDNFFREAGNTSGSGSGESGNSGSTGSETNTTGDNTGNENTNTSGTDNTGSNNSNSFGKDDDSKNWLVSILENVFVGFFEGIINPIKQIFEFLGKVLTGIPNFFATILDYLNPFSDNFILSKVIDFLGKLVSFINPFSDNFFGIKLIELLKNLLQTLFIPEERLV